ncbi:hypothetical protein DDB_G0284661 [Dictyostelium discoideum AX4]|uniref:Probable myosin light chain kinase DDB_G0284661 n=1 Tax=Dictyostelium discoideum TaxID=44689 RepID=MYLKE_DICDI|nr:hypothetical protein DDB_G0284661 [Dictyostelium discoideum AX4]Q54PB4.1 RecName: Full=Probable myosin light chain kinase DDB_G0284661 [Dictyostelium discoideum]EAL65100.1 hypothetical protein DDB_G0284661 [Dictyostelium discoideum AX4]|eukprot:XP_638461.1 hypothetical protein DDB_G0284661 [Dictyostelium discoideum AX4]
MPSNPNRSIYDFYNITDIIGEGTFSTVTLANHIEKIEDKYAIKIISKEVLDNERRTYVDWEISILSKCQHPNIIKFYEHYESDEDICLVLEWIPNGDLFDRIVKKGVFNEEEARLTMKSLLSAVEYLHDKSVVHRDIKPENILFSDSYGGIKLGDFGLAKFYEESIGLELACGTLAYSAPEITNNQVYRKSVDMWSCGCILYFILFGRPPFYSDDESEMFELITKGQWEFPSKTQHKYSDQVKDLIKLLLENDPNKRLTVKQSLAHKWIQSIDERSFSSVIKQSPLITSQQQQQQSPSSLLSSSSSSTASSPSLKPLSPLVAIIEQQEYNYNHQQLQNHNILHSSNSHSRHHHASSANSTTVDQQQEEDNNHHYHRHNSNNNINNNNDNNDNNNSNSNNSNNNINNFINNNNNNNNNNSNFFDDDDEIDINQNEMDDIDDEQQQPTNSLRSSSKPIAIKKSQIRTSLNGNIDIKRGVLTPL